MWSGWDYIGEPTPYSTFPVKTSFFGLEDTAGFPKDQYYLFKSQWNPAPMVHIVPMNWTDYKRGQVVQVWTYANEPTVELFLNGVSLGTKSFTRKTTTFGRHYLETTECPGDDKNYTGGTCPGSYQSPNGSSGKLHLTWNVPFQPGRLVAVAGRERPRRRPRPGRHGRTARRPAPYRRQGIPAGRRQGAVLRDGSCRRRPRHPGSRCR